MEKFTTRLINSEKKHMKVALVTLILVTLIAGFHLMLDPATVNHLVIRAVGFGWVLQGLLTILEWYTTKFK